MTSSRRLWRLSRALDDRTAPATGRSELDPVHDRLTRDVAAHRRAAPAGLKARVIGTLADERWNRAPAASRPKIAAWMGWLAAAALAVVTGFLMWGRPEPIENDGVQGPFPVVSSVQQMTPSFESMRELTDGALRREMENLASDASRAVGAVRDGLPRPLRVGLRRPR